LDNNPANFRFLLYGKGISLNGVKMAIDLHTLGKEQAALNLLNIVCEISDQRNRLHNLRWVQTILSRFGRGVNVLKKIDSPHIRMEMVVLWRKDWVNTINRKGTVGPNVKSHLRSVVYARTREIMRTAFTQIKENKEQQKNQQ
jgi:hypothetical protein